MFNFLKNNKLFHKLNTFQLSFLVVMACYVFTYLVFDIVFNDKDDVVIQQIIQGFYLDTPDVHLVFINVLIGYLLKPLYLLTNQVYWYSILMVLLQFIALQIIYEDILKRKLGWIINVSILIFFQYLIIRLQFTSVSAVLCIAGFFLLKAQVSELKRYIILPLLLLYFSFLLRMQMFVLMGFFLIVFILVFEQKLLFSLFKKTYLVQFGAFLGLVIISIYADSLHYKSTDWKHFKEYSDTRGKVNDNPMLQAYVKNTTQPNTQKLSDFEMIFTYFLPLKDYNKTELSNLLIEAKQSSNAVKYQLESIKFNILHKNNIMIFIFMFFLIGYALFYKQYKILIPVIAFGIVFLYISASMIFKNRLSFPILLLFFVYFSTTQLYPKVIQYIAMFYAVFILFSNITFYNFFPNNSKTVSFPDDKPLIALNSTWKNYHPFKLNVINNQKDILILGWMSDNPLLKSKIESYGLQLNQHFSPFDDPNINHNFYFYIENIRSLETYNSNLRIKNCRLVSISNYENIYRVEKL